jgi:hypothetical protein
MHPAQQTYNIADTESKHMAKMATSMCHSNKPPTRSSDSKVREKALRVAHSVERLNVNLELHNIGVVQCLEQSNFPDEVIPCTRIGVASLHFLDGNWKGAFQCGQEHLTNATSNQLPVKSLEGHELTASLSSRNYHRTIIACANRGQAVAC